ncbi:MAG: hypothetical protein U0269_32505 [Polyangiales bacterium]
MADDRTATNKVKGHTFKSWFEAYEKVCGAPAKSALILALDKDFSDAVRFGALVASGWYPIHWYTSLYEVHARLAGRTPGFARKMGRITTEQDLRGVYSFIVKLASPATVLTNAQRLLKLYVQQCETFFMERGPTHVRFTMTIPGSTDEMWEEFTGGSEAILSANGARDPVVSFARIDDKSVFIDGAWKER